MASPTQWTWVWGSSRSWWWTERPGMLQSMGSQRVGHDWATELKLNLNKHTGLNPSECNSSKISSVSTKKCCLISDHCLLYLKTCLNHIIILLFQFNQFQSPEIFSKYVALIPNPSFFTMVQLQSWGFISQTFEFLFTISYNWRNRHNFIQNLGKFNQVFIIPSIHKHPALPEYEISSF